jgi:aspartate aminotransferase
MSVHEVDRRAPVLSKRAIEMPASPIRRLAPLAAAAKARGTRVLHLNIGQPDIETPACMRDRLRQLDSRVLEYSPSGGTPEFVEALARYYARAVNAPLTANQILATTGGSEAILFAMYAVADAGDDILVVEPFYTNYRAFAAMAGIRLVPLTSSGEDGFHLPPREAWERVLTPSTRAVLLCNPNNPTGTVYTREEVERIAGFCRDHGLYLIADEVYREFVYDGRKPVSALQLEGMDQLAIVVDSLSKRYSACGIRLGALVTRNRQVYDACMKMAQGRLSPPGLAQFIALGIDSVDESYTQAVVTEYQRRRDVLFAGLRSIPGVSLQKPEGAFYCVAKLPVDDADRFAAWMLGEYQHDGATVMVAPASGFYVSPLGRSEVRIAYVLREEDLLRSIDIIGRAIEAYARR